MSPQDLLAAVRQAYTWCSTEEERVGVELTACELAARMFPNFRDYKNWLAATRATAEQTSNLAAWCRAREAI